MLDGETIHNEFVAKNIKKGETITFMSNNRVKYSIRKLYDDNVLMN